MIERVLLFGSNGQIGNSMIELLETSYSTIAMNSDNIDYNSREELDKLFKFIRPHHVINCVAYTDVDGAEKPNNHDKCRYLNYSFPLHLNYLCAQYNSQFIHFGTDYVFDGTKESYTEKDYHNPLNFYGSTKSEIERSLNYSKTKLFRVQCVYSGRNKNFYKSIDALADKLESINVIDDQITCPTHAAWIAEMVFNVLDEPQYGIFNLNPDGNCSFAEFAELIVGDRCKINKITTEEYVASKTKRPKNGVLNNSKFKQTFNFSSLPTWDQVYKKYK